MIPLDEENRSPRAQPAAAFAQDLQRAVERIAGVLEREVPLLRALRGQEVEALLEEKQAATDGYLALAESLRATPELLNGLAPEERDRLKAAAGGLAAATEANARALRAGIEANGRLVKTIAQAIGEQHLGGGRYRPDGRPRTAESKGATPACSVNKVL